MCKKHNGLIQKEYRVICNNEVYQKANIIFVQL